MIEFISFCEARKFVRELNLKNRDEWQIYCKSGKKPENIPSNPNRTYKKLGWSGYGDWLGTGKIAPQVKKFLEFNEARKFVISLKMHSFNEWKKYAKSSQRPINIPANPHSIYKTAGWSSYGDWLGTGKIASRNRVFREFIQARDFVRKLKLKNVEEWRRYCKSDKPDDIPVNPDSVYHKHGWISYGDWLGTGKIATQFRTFREYNEAKQFVHKLKILNSLEWKKYCRSGCKPSDIPSAPDKQYRNQGWEGYSEWLGRESHLFQSKI